MIIIKNKSKYLNKKQINDCFELLNEKYKNINVQIIFYRSYLQYLLSRIIFSGINVSKYTHGLYSPNKKIICIYEFRTKKLFNQTELIKLQILYNLLHEIRHCYQYIYAPNKYYKDIISYIKEGEGYQKQWMEKDANRFTQTFMRKYHDKISFNLNFENYTWEITKR